MRINYDFTDLEAFLAVMETGSFNRAADTLNLSQSAITRRIQKLETALDSPLFERTTRAVRPTLAARRLHARAQAMLEDARETAIAMRDESVSFQHQRNAVVTIAIIPSAVQRLLPQAIRMFRDAGHRARIRLLDSAANDVAAAVAEGGADFGVCSIPSLEPTTTFERLFDDQIILAMPPDHRLSQHAALNWTDLSNIDLIMPARGTGNRLLIDEAMVQARLPLLWTFEVSRSTTALELVTGGAGAALLPRSAVPPDMAAHMAVRPMVRPDILRPVGLISRTGQSETSGAAALKAAIRSVGWTPSHDSGLQTTGPAA